MRDHADRFIERLDSLILSGRSSFEIGRTLGIRDTSVRQRRRKLRQAGLLPFFERPTPHVRNQELR